MVWPDPYARAIAITVAIAIAARHDLPSLLAWASLHLRCRLRRHHGLRPVRTQRLLHRGAPCNVGLGNSAFFDVCPFSCMQVWLLHFFCVHCFSFFWFWDSDAFDVVQRGFSGGAIG